MSRASKRLLILLGVPVLLGVVVVAAANVVVTARTAGAATTELPEIRSAQVAIVPGSLVRDDGSLGTAVRQRVTAAVELYRDGRVGAILMSGDNGRAEYNEPDAMRDAALAAGVPAEDVFTDYAGFSTWATMRRAHDVFGVTDAVVITQELYMPRTVHLARAAEIDVQGLAVGDGGGLVAREVLARVRGLGQSIVRPGVTEGAPIPIGGDGRTSWAVS